MPAPSRQQVFTVVNTSASPQTITKNGVSVTVQPGFVIGLDWPNGDTAAAIATGNFKFVGQDWNDLYALGYNPVTQQVRVRV